jgi:putative hemolysin
MIIGATTDSLVLPRDRVTPRDANTVAPDAIDERASPDLDVVSGHLQVRLAASAQDIDAVQALRYRIFYETMGAQPSLGMKRRQRDFDPFDEICDHLMVLDHSRGHGAEAVVGTYRLIRREAARRCGRFYSAAEYDISRLVTYPGPVLELGRSCVDPAYRASTLTSSRCRCRISTTTAWRRRSCARARSPSAMSICGGSTRTALTPNAR